jgi:hypothetical protein
MVTRDSIRFLTESRQPTEPTPPDCGQLAIITIDYSCCSHVYHDTITFLKIDLNLATTFVAYRRWGFLFQDVRCTYP